MQNGHAMYTNASGIYDFGLVVRRRECKILTFYIIMLCAYHIVYTVYIGLGCCCML